ncbi:MAG TPA: hypothetical protein VEB19_06155 [Gemmatimonadaceae bacterium]|nr:hypothetical protein [Gemmatimonadaceae bacterium]
MTDWSLRVAQEKVTSLVTDVLTPEEYATNRRYIEDDDHWQDGDEWVGPKGDGSAQIRTRILARVEPQFTPSDAMGEACGRWVNALVKTEADAMVDAREPGAVVDGEPAMTKQQEQRAGEIRGTLFEWWDRVRLWEKVRIAALRSRWNGRGVLRARIPDGVRGEDGSLPTGLSAVDALALIDITAEESDAAGVYIDPDTLKRSAVLLYKEGESERAQVWEIGDDGVLTVRVFGGDQETSAEPTPIPGATRLPIVEMQQELLITETVRRLNRQLNFLQTLITRNGETASFPERYGLNAAPQGIWSRTAPVDTKPLQQEVIDGVTWYLYEVPLTLGASTFVNLRGFEYSTDENGGKSVTSPSVVRFDPVPPNFAIDPAVHAYAVLMRNCHQGHVLAAEAAQRSGFSIEQARADFETDVEKGRGPIEALVAGIIEAALSLAAAMSDEAAEILRDYRPVVTLHVDTGPRSVAERTQDAADVAAGLLSDETAMLRSGIEDVAAERARIAASPQGAHADARRQWELAKIIGEAAGFDNVTCAVLAGVPVEKITEALELSMRLNAPPDPAQNGNGVGRGVPALTQ